MNKNYIPPLYYGFLTPTYDLFCSIFGFGKHFRRKVLDKILLKPKGRALDVGCGTGVLAMQMKIMRPNATIVGIDPDKMALEIAKARSAKEGLKIDFLLGSAESLPFPGKKFDVVTSTLVFHHLKTNVKKAAMKEIIRVLKPNGSFILTDFGPPRHKFLPSFSLISALFEEGKENYEGKIPVFLKEAGFKDVKIVGEPKANIFTILAKK